VRRSQPRDVAVAASGEEWNHAYVVTLSNGAFIKLVRAGRCARTSPALAARPPRIGSRMGQRSRRLLAAGLLLAVLAVIAVLIVRTLRDEPDPVVATPAAAAAPPPSVAVPPVIRAEDVPPPVQPLPASTDGKTIVRVTVTDAAGAGVPGVDVWVSGQDDDRQARTGAGGLVELEYPPRACTVSANLSGAWARHGCASREVTLAAGETTPITLVLPFATASLFVFVNDDAGAPVRDVVINANSSAGAPNRGKLVTDQRGLAVLDGIVPGNWSVAIDKAGPAVDLTDKPSLSVDVPPDKEVSVHLSVRRMGEIVLITSDLARVADLVSVNGTGLKEKRAPWSKDGTSWLVPAGQYALHAEWEASSALWSPYVPLNVLPGERVQAHLAPQAGEVEVAGRVVDTDGRPVAGAVILLVAWADSQAVPLDRLLLAQKSRKTSFTDAGGAWHAKGFPAGELRVGVLAQTAPGRSFEDHVPLDDSKFYLAGGFADLGTFTALPAVNLQGTLDKREADLCSSHAARLVLFRTRPPMAAGALGVRVYPKDDGTFLVKQLAIGTYEARMVNGGLLTVRASMAFTIPADAVEGSTVEQSFHFPP
jgi:hypothetical protein